MLNSTKIRITASTPYNIIICQNSLEQVGYAVKEVLEGDKIAILTDDKVDHLYGKRVMDSLSKNGFKCYKFVIKNGENSKNMESLISFINFLATNRITRNDAVLALGGGVIGDIAGFAAAIFLRGIKYIQVPTTLLAAVDSSVGGKTAVDISAGKNLVGAFHQPSLVYCDISTLDTLKPNVLRDGFAEVIKYGIIMDNRLFQQLLEPPVKHLKEIITRCVEIKRDVVNADEFDKGTRQLLNFGHTVGHAVELLSNFSISHGSAVAIGMVRAAKIGALYGLKDFTQSITHILEQYEFNLSCPYNADQIFSAALSDKKCAGDNITLVLPEEIGKCELYKIPISRLKKLLKDTEI